MYGLGILTVTGTGTFLATGTILGTWIKTGLGTRTCTGNPINLGTGTLCLIGMEAKKGIGFWTCFITGITWGTAMGLAKNNKNNYITLIIKCIENLKQTVV